MKQVELRGAVAVRAPTLKRCQEPIAGLQLAWRAIEQLLRPGVFHPSSLKHVEYWDHSRLRGRRDPEELAAQHSIEPASRRVIACHRMRQ